MVSVNYQEGISEVIDILENMDRNDVKKIPNKFIKFLYDNRSKTYKSNLDHSKRLSEMKLKKETRFILSIIYTKYWCN